VQARCHKQGEFVARIERALDVRMGPVTCTIVDESGMAEVMGRAGWNRNDSHGVVGFQIGKEIFVLGRAPWTVLHELIHRAGVNSDRLSRFVAEGLTEAIAREIKAGPDEHQPTYPRETRWVQEVLLPRLKMTAVQLGQVIAKANNAPRALAKLMVEASSGASEANLVRVLQPQQTGEPSFNRRGHVTRWSSGGTIARGPTGHDSVSVGLGLVAIVAGGALVLSGCSSASPRA
jgi:hypothetical protein